MPQQLGALTLLVRDYDETIAFFTQILQFVLIEDTPLSPEKRWVRVAPAGSNVPCLLLARASTATQLAAIGNQAGGRVFLFLYTDNFWHDYATMQQRGVQFLEAPRCEAYGTVVVFADLYGNKWDLIELNAA
jgi:catechol 2,3-dioxygenase-like lactoylglutathione lyase family enzyme